MHVGTKSQSLYSDRIWSLHLSNGGLGLYNIKRFHPPGIARDKPDLLRTIQNFSPDVFPTLRNQTTSQTWHKLSEPPCVPQGAAPQQMAEPEKKHYGIGAAPGEAKFYQPLLYNSCISLPCE